jgi:hypothetical protein
MEHALHLPNPRRSLAIPLAAALLGAGVATTTYALTDTAKTAQSPSKLVIVTPSERDSTAPAIPAAGHRP